EQKDHDARGKQQRDVGAKWARGSWGAEMDAILAKEFDHAVVASAERPEWDLLGLALLVGQGDRFGYPIEEFDRHLARNVLVAHDDILQPRNPTGGGHLADSFLDFGGEFRQL